ncbi:hypothetical protein AAFN86_08450 [Roseomonas sp. CAU 1739]|uniref:hypothetical protein n=1 Tax=Roseomonas sp. CAU 1739 TaxID=3140364 RepID=UPI00325AAC7C
MSTTFDEAPRIEPRSVRIGWLPAGIGAAAIACLGFGAGYGAAMLRPAGASGGFAVTGAARAGTAPDLAIHVERLADVERSFAEHRGRLVEADALLRSGAELRVALRAGGSYAAPLAAVLGLRGGADALGPLREPLVRGAGGAPDSAELSAELDAIALSVLALGDEQPASWSARMMQRVDALLRSDSRAARQDGRRQVFDTARDAASRPGRRAATQDCGSAAAPIQPP